MNLFSRSGNSKSGCIGGTRRTKAFAGQYGGKRGTANETVCERRKAIAIEIHLTGGEEKTNHADDEGGNPGQIPQEANPPSSGKQKEKSQKKRKGA